jgi:organic hydroperoxide reductase OsmC/OhrA
MSQETIPSGKDARAPQADGDPSGQRKEAAAPAASASPTETLPFGVNVTWSGDGTGCGLVRIAGLASPVPVGGAEELGGCGKGSNPEQLLLASIGACFVNTWAIFLKKLGLDYSDPAVGVDGQLQKDPAGGYRMVRTRIRARVPASLLEREREKVEKTLALAEKYCIISKVARQGMPVEVEIEPF